MKTDFWLYLVRMKVSVLIFALSVNAGCILGQDTTLDNAIDTVANERAAKFWAQRALHYTQQSNYRKAAYYFDKAQKYYSQNKASKEFTMLLLDLIGLYEEVGNYEASLEYGFEALSLAEKNNFSLQRTQALIRIAWTYYNKRKPKVSEKYIRQAAEASLKYSQTAELATSYNLLGQLLSSVNSEEAEAKLRTALNIRIQLKDEPGTSEAYASLGELYSSRMDYDSALFYHMKADDIISHINQPLGKAYTLLYIGKTYIKLRDLKKAAYYINRAEKLADSINSGTVMVKVLSTKRELAKSKNDLENYVKYTQAYEALSDSLYNYSESNRVLLMESRAEVQKKNAEIQLQKATLQNQERELNLRLWQISIMSLGALLMAVIAVILYTSNKSTRRLNLKIVEQNNDLAATQEEIQTQNEELVVKNEEISAQRDMIQEQRNVLDSKNDELKRAVKARTKDLIQYIQQLEQFTFISSHNLRAPIARILGLGNLLEMQGLNSADAVTIHKALINCSRELDAVITDLNSVLEVRQNTNIVLTQVSLFEEMQIIRSSLQNLLAKNQAVIVDTFSDAQLIRTYRPYFQSIMLHLITNAIKYRKPDVKPVITVKVINKKKFICIAVKDNGLGIDMEKYGDKIFMLYKRFHDHIEGKGLGLCMVKTQIMSLGGKVKVKSEVNVGSTFYLYFKKEKQASF